ncbi:hypothetical protein ACHQM5_030897 [Ranunculus cassubicifolius]
MSISPEFREIGNFINRRASEKSNFSQTCNLLSQFLKDKGNLVANTPRGLEKAPAMDLFPQHTGFGVSGSAAMEDAPKVTELSETKQTTTMPKAAQMTIMYAGKVLVFDEISEDKVKELMSLASNASLQNTLPLDLKTGATKVENVPIPRPIPAHVSGLPIARKASLHRFLEKRKDRINAKAPYQMAAPTTKPTESKPEEPKSWLGLASPCSSDLGL